MSPRALVLIACFLAAGCSGGSSGGSASTTAPATSAATSTSSSAGVTSTTTSGTNSGIAITPPVLPANLVLVPFETLDEGAGSPRGFAQGAHEVQVATAPDWTVFWPTHSTARPPIVDFSQSTVVGSFMGQIGGGSHFTQIVNVKRDTNSDDLRATVREFRLGAWKPNTRILTSPFHLVRAETAVSGQGTLAVDRQILLDFETLRSGSDSALGAGNPAYTGGLHVARDAAAFQALWAQIQPNARPPAVDFTREMVVAVLGPYVPSFGNTVETRRLVHDVASDEIRVIHRVNPYSGGAPPPRAVETPFQILRVTIATGKLRAERTSAITMSQPSSGIARGTSPSATAETRVVRDAARWSQVWAAEVGGAAPTGVDFSKDQVLLHVEPAGSARTVSFTTSVVLEDDELAISLSSLTTGPTRDGRYTWVTTPRTFGPISAEVIDRTPRP